jgi:uncharacterized membrane protein (DUF2068 family)
VILGFVGVAALGSGGVLSTAATIVLIITAILAIIELVVAWGLWTLKAWAFWTAVVVEAIRFIDGLYGLLAQHNNGSIVNLVIAAVILIYLFADRNVRAAFRT